jgi:type I restriction enzyme S subunit
MISNGPFTLRDFVSLQRGTTYKSNLLGLPGPVLLGLASIQANGGFRRGSFKTYGGESPAKITLAPGELYVSLKDVTQTGDLLGAVARLPSDIKLGRLTQDTVKLNFNGRPISQKYIYWLLRTPGYREYCRARGTGTTTLGLGRDDFLDFPVQEPSESANNLVDLLEALDERIALLNEMNITLEAIAQRLFRSWFVDFDPVHAKQKLILPVGMDSDTAGLFPNSFDETEAELLPKGWRFVKSSDVVDIRDGTHESPKPALVGYRFITTRNISTGSINFENSYLISEDNYLNYSRRSKVEKFDVLISMIGTVGIPVIVLRDDTDFAVKNIGILKTSREKHYSFYIYLLLKSDKAQQLIESRLAGTTQKYLSLSALREIKIVWPSDSILRKFEEVVSPLFGRRSLNENAIRSTAILRDALLSRLDSDLPHLPGEVAQMRHAA